MLPKETVEKGTLDLIHKLMTDQERSSFNLAGGTALALKIGHRKSIDIDLFSAADFDSTEISNHLSANYNTTRLQVVPNGVFCLIDNIKVDLLSHKYPLVEGIDVVENVRMVSLRDIGAMKLNAIYNNGTRIKDFIDLYYLLEKFSLGQLLKACHQKYPNIHIQMVAQSIIHYGDIDFTVPIDHINPAPKWSDIVQRINDAFGDFTRTF